MTFVNQRRWIIFAAGIITLAVFVKVAPANHSWNGYHWARTTPQFTLKLGDNMTSADWKGHLSQASQDWNNPGLDPTPTWTGSQPLLTTIVPGQSTSKRCSTVAGTTQVCNGSYGNNGWLGLATIYIDSALH